MADTALSPGDAERILDAALDLTRATGRDDLFERILVQTAALVDSETTSFNWMAPGRIAALLRPEVEPAWFAELSAVFTEHWRQNPLAAYFERTADTRALTWDDVERNRTWRDGTLYREFFEPMKVTQQLAVRLASPPGTVAGLACNRSSVPFSDRDRAVLTTFGRHAFAHLDAMTEHAARHVSVVQRGWQTVLVDADSRIVGGGAASVVGDGPVLPPPLRELLERQLAVAMVESSGPMAPTPPEEVTMPAGRYAAFVVPSSMPPYLLFLRPLSFETTVTTDVGPLVTAGLSGRESVVAAHLATGATNRQIADALEIQVGTVKKHIQRIFLVLGVETRAAAAATTVRLLG